MPIKNAHNRFNDWFYLLRPELKNKLWHRNPLPNRTNICALAHGEVGKCLLVNSVPVHAEFQVSEYGYTGLREVQVKNSLPCRGVRTRSEEHTSELQSRLHLVCRL